MNAGEQAIWTKLELSFTSGKSYKNPVYAVRKFGIHLVSPTGRRIQANGFWDGGSEFKVRFMPDELGDWTWKSFCSDKYNKGLFELEGRFTCVENDSVLALYKHGAIIHPKGTYHLAHADGTPFFWTACTAWNGAMKATDEEWEYYLSHRVEHNYSAIQFCTTQWRGLDVDRKGRTAFEGSGIITINPEFFQDLDKRVDEVNAHGLLAAPVLLWALPAASGRDLSPGYHLPIDEAVLLARYIAARYNGNHVLWFLGGDGKYFDELESRWKTIGERVFKSGIQGLATLHPHGRCWIGSLYHGEDWYDLAGYQSSHSSGEETVNFINNERIANEWKDISPMPIINLEPNYEEINFKIDAEDVRNASYWSLLVAPVSGITYGANGIWPWLQVDGEEILNHELASGTSTWRKSIDFPGSKQIGYLAGFMKQFDWWNFRPANELLLEQPGRDKYSHWIAVTESLDHSTILAYVPVKSSVKIRNFSRAKYDARWFNPVTNKSIAAQILNTDGVIHTESPLESDLVLVLEKQ